MATCSGDARGRDELTFLASQVTFACDDAQLNLPSDGHAELPGGGQRDYIV